MWVLLVVAALALISVSVWLFFRMAAFMVGAPLSIQPADPTTDENGFTRVGDLLFPASDKKTGPRVVPALVDPAHTSVAMMPSSASSWLLAAWPDGAYLKTRCPGMRLFASGHVSKATYLSEATFSEAYRRHCAALAEISVSRGAPLRVDGCDDALQCLKTAGKTARRLFMGTMLAIAPLGIAIWVMIIMAKLFGG